MTTKNVFSFSHRAVAHLLAVTGACAVILYKYIAKKRKWTKTLCFSPQIMLSDLVSKTHWKDKFGRQASIIPREFPDARPLPMNFKLLVATGINCRGRANVRGRRLWCQEEVLCPWLFKQDLLNELLGLKETTQVEHLPRGQTNETAHGEDAEVQHTCVGGFCKTRQMGNQKTHKNWSW